MDDYLAKAYLVIWQHITEGRFHILAVCTSQARAHHALARILLQQITSGYKGYPPITSNETYRIAKRDRSGVSAFTIREVPLNVQVNVGNNIDLRLVR